MSDELDPALRALLDVERSAPLPGAAEAKAPILSAVRSAGAGAVMSAGASAGASTGASTGAATAGTWSTKVLLLVAVGAGSVGAAVGSIATTALTQPVSDAPPITAPEQPAETADGEDEEDELEAREPSQGEPERVPPQPVLEVSSHERPETPVMQHEEEREAAPSSLAAERTLIDQALSALRAHHAQNALRALMSHERRFPQGALSEERDRLSVEALVQLGRADQARRRAELFETRHPDSAHLQRVRSLIE